MPVESEHADPINESHKPSPGADAGVGSLPTQTAAISRSDPKSRVNKLKGKTLNNIELSLYFIANRWLGTTQAALGEVVVLVRDNVV